jgi:hypothetical protein
VLSTIKQNPHLFWIITPIKVDVFESYLKAHPNRPFVKSVCQGLRDGFWPWADTNLPDYPITWDNSHRPLKDDAHKLFLTEQADIEVAARHFSSAFGNDLLLEMYSSPLGVVPKLRMVVDQSAEPFSPNSMIPKIKCRVQMDSLYHLGHALKKVRSTHPDARLIGWKSDVSNAYQLIPMHPFWQIKQIATVDGKRFVNRCNHFGNGCGGRCYGCVADLMLWIAENVKRLKDIFGYVDDDFSYEFEGELELYEPYEAWLPAKQTQLLKLWDELGIPHEEHKQVWGPTVSSQS